MTSTLLAAAAHINAVCPSDFSRAFGSAPRARSIFTMRGSPVRAAVISAVSPSAIAVFGSAPADRSRSAIAALAVWLAAYLVFGMRHASRRSYLWLVALSLIGGIALGGAMVGYAWLGPIGAIIGLGAGIAAGGSVADKGRFYRP